MKISSALSSLSDRDLAIIRKADSGPLDFRIAAMVRAAFGPEFEECPQACLDTARLYALNPSPGRPVPLGTALHMLKIDERRFQELLGADYYNEFVRHLTWAVRLTAVKRTSLALEEIYTVLREVERGDDPQNPNGVRAQWAAQFWVDEDDSGALEL